MQLRHRTAYHAGRVEQSPPRQYGQPVVANLAFASYHLPDEFGELRCSCWCEQTTLHIPAVWVKAGVTKSCGAKGCQP